MQLRVISLGVLPPELLHKTYMGLAEAQKDDDPPVLLLVQSEPHLSLGAAQSASAELDHRACANLGIPVLQRALGGGLVWVDSGQLNYFFIFPMALGIRRGPELFARTAPWIVALHARFGLQIEARDGHDFWCASQKIGGTGAATIGRSLVMGGSLMLHVDWKPFVNCVAAPSAGFRAWLAEALQDSLWTWSRLLPQVPSVEDIRNTFPEVLESGDIQVTRVATLKPAEQQAVTAAELEEPEWEMPASRRVPAGIKIKAGAFLTERQWPDGSWLRIWTENGGFRKVAASVWSENQCRVFTGLRAESQEMTRALQELAGEACAQWSARFAETAVWKD
ncbi:ligase [Acidithiobacillus marinus]|uniref:Ligase n=1 Tax=Acidithiobacillus marinus TaxID=187490 RepID=A0A2I1DLA3_9PROT|nr:ligase [Acidithiobacillus marinus]PKY10655.1 ligase [Acidithiobacillus marinus]